jgi:hypothetical protein
MQVIQETQQQVNSMDTSQCKRKRYAIVSYHIEPQYYSTTL